MTRSVLELLGEVVAESSCEGPGGAVDATQCPCLCQKRTGLKYWEERLRLLGRLRVTVTQVCAVPHPSPGVADFSMVNQRLVFRRMTV